jgi:hypothetical protein
VNNFLSRKFLLTLAILITSGVALFLNVLDSGSWVAVSTLVLAGYSVGNVGEKHLVREVHND